MNEKLLFNLGLIIFQSDCDFLDYTNEIPDVLLNSKYYEQITRANYSYTRSICVDFCVHDQVGRRHNCFNPTSSIRLSFADNLTTCNQSLIKDIPYRDIKRVCSSECPLECTTSMYTTFVTKSDITDYNYDQIKHLISLENNILDKFTSTAGRKDLLVLKIYLKSKVIKL
jgi:hypothetical protein